jgi:hypothetical protein
MMPVAEKGEKKVKRGKKTQDIPAQGPNDVRMRTGKQQPVRLPMRAL